MNTFKNEHPLTMRTEIANKIRKKYQDRIPVILSKAPKSDVPEINRKKYLVPIDITVGRFVYEIRKQMKLEPEKALFIFVNNIFPPSSYPMSQIYEKYKDEDGFLYIVYSGENTFGMN